MMNQFWQMATEDRQTFKEFSAYIEHEAGYLQLRLNPIAAKLTGGMEEVEVEDDGEDGEARKDGGSGGDGEGEQGKKGVVLEDRG